MFKQIDVMGIALRKSQFKAMESKPRSLVERREGIGIKGREVARKGPLDGVLEKTEREIVQRRVRPTGLEIWE